MYEKSSRFADFMDKFQVVRLFLQKFSHQEKVMFPFGNEYLQIGNLLLKANNIFMVIIFLEDIQILFSVFFSNSTRPQDGLFRIITFLFQIPCLCF